MCSGNVSAVLLSANIPGMRLELDELSMGSPTCDADIDVGGASRCMEFGSSVRVGLNHHVLRGPFPILGTTGAIPTEPGILGTTGAFPTVPGILGNSGAFPMNAGTTAPTGSSRMFPL